MASSAYNLVFRDVRAASFLPGYQPFREDFLWLFNSYNSLAEGPPQKPLRGSFSRPSLDEVLAFRSYVDAAMGELFAYGIHDDAARRVLLGVNHEQQYQELMLTGIKHAFFSNPLRTAYDAKPLVKAHDVLPSDFTWYRFQDRITEIGYPLGINALDFCFDNETPRHKVYLETFGISTPPPRVASIWSLCPMMHMRGRNFGFPMDGT